MELDLDIRPTMEFPRHPVFMSEADLEKLGRRIRLNCAVGKTLASPWFKYPLALTASVAAQATVEHLGPDFGMFGSWAKEIALVAAVTTATILGSEYLSRYFKGNVERMSADFVKQIRRRHDWQKYQRDLYYRVHENIAESAAARKARTRAQEGDYVIPSVRGLPYREEMIDSLEGLLPTEGIRSFDRAAWKKYSQTLRVKKAALETISRRHRTETSVRFFPGKLGERLREIHIAEIHMG